MNKDSISYIKIWKKFIVISISCLMIFTALVQSNQITLNDDITLTYAFDTPTIETIDIAGTLYDRVNLLDCYPAGNAGEPKIPSKGVFLLLPPESKVSEIDIIPGEKIVIGSGFVVEPTSQAIPISQTENLPIPNPNEAMYHCNAAYPGKLFTQVGVYPFRGYQILVLLLYPIQYNPVTGELFYYHSLEISVKTVATGVQSALYRDLEQDNKEVQQKVDNPGMSLQYNQKYPSSSTPFEHYDLLIITNDALKSSFEPLKQAHDATGVQTVIKTLTDIGGSDPESIRNYIRDAYIGWGIEYVLIGGDNMVVPAPILWVSGMDENVTPYETDMPADLYYACLDGPYDYDTDGNWGEPHDGENGGDVDLIAEVYVGRVCVSNPEDVNNFVAKTIAYINKDVQNEFFTRITLAGEYLGDFGIASYSGTSLDQLVDRSTDDGYTTVGIPSSEYTINKLYDSPGNDWNPSEIISIINNGVHIINHDGHSSYGYNMKLGINEVDALTNPSNRTCFIYSQGCMAGGFDSGDCIAEHFTVTTPHAAFAGIWNARYGFFWSYSTDGDSQRLNRQFWDAVFNEMIPEIGRANHDSKEDNLPIIGRSCIRWCYYETNLFGDPSLKMTENENHAPEKPDVPSGPTSGSINTTYSYSTSTTDLNNDMVKYGWDWNGDNTIDQWDDNNGNYYLSGTTITTSYTWNEEGTYNIKVKTEDKHGAQSDWSDPLPITMPYSYDKPILQFLELLFQRFPHAFPILRQLLG
jgi:hypothetical protein